MRARSFRSAAVWTALVVSLSVVSTDAGERVPGPAPERIPELVRDLGMRLSGRTLPIPGGGEATLFGAADTVPAPILTPDRLARCLATISEAEGWPAAWLVVQDGARDYDLLLRMRLTEDGSIADPDPVFAAPRRDEWEAPAIEAAAREATGRKPVRERNVVIQSFTKKTETTYVYEPVEEDSPMKGLLALLPGGSLIREAKRIDLGDGKFHTLALVVVDAKFVPSDCASCVARAAGHVDTGTVLAVLAGEKALEHTLDLTPVYRDHAVRPFLPRYACVPADEVSQPAGQSVSKRFRGREPIVPLGIEATPSGERTLRLPLQDDCERRASIEIAIAPDPPKIRVSGIR